MVSYEIDVLDLEGFIVGSAHLLQLVDHFPCDKSHTDPVNIEGYNFLGLSKADT